MNTLHHPNSNRNRTYIIAEMACSHEGDPSLARKIIDGAGQARADAIQFQIWSLKDTVVPNHPDYGMLQRIELAPDTWRELANYSRQHYPAMHIIACVYDRSSVDFAETIDVDAYKLNSQDLSNPNLIDRVSRKLKRIDLSIGASTIGEIQSALEHIAAARQNSGKPDVWLMYGYQGFPTPTDAINLNYMMKLKQLFELPIGYQDHSDGNSEAAFWLPAAALGMGVDVLEKHITHDRSYKGIDHEAALNPDEFARFVHMVREIEASKGSSTPRAFSPEEVKYRKYAKKSIVAAHDLAEGQIVGPNDLLFMRADSLGIPPDQTERLIGRSTKRAVSAYHLINEDDVN